MDISIAKQLVDNLIKNKTAELESFKLAQSILLNTFKAEFENLENAQHESSELSQKLNITIQEKQNIESILETKKIEHSRTNILLEEEIQARIDDVAKLTTEKQAVEIELNSIKDNIIKEKI